MRTVILYMYILAINTTLVHAYQEKRDSSTIFEVIHAKSVRSPLLKSSNSETYQGTLAPFETKGIGGASS